MPATGYGQPASLLCCNGVDIMVFRRRLVSPTAGMDGGASVAVRQRHEVLFLPLHMLFVVVSILDIFFTNLILSLDGREVNPIANLVLEHWAMNGMIAFKFCLVALVVIIIEEVGRQQYAKGRWLAIVSISISSVPIFLAVGQLAVYMLG